MARQSLIPVQDPERDKQKQDAQLSQKDSAAGYFIVFAKSRTLELGANDLRTLQVYLQPL